jgi:hypothetical protein
MTGRDEDGTHAEFDESDLEDQPRPPRDGGPGAARTTSISGEGGIRSLTSTYSGPPGYRLILD